MDEREVEGKWKESGKETPMRMTKGYNMALLYVTNPYGSLLFPKKEQEDNGRAIMRAVKILFESVSVL